MKFSMLITLIASVATSFLLGVLLGIFVNYKIEGAATPLEGVQYEGKEELLLNNVVYEIKVVGSTIGVMRSVTDADGVLLDAEVVNFDLTK